MSRSKPYPVRDLSYEEIHDIFKYNKEKGTLEWKVLSRGRREIVGTVTKFGYRVVGLRRGEGKNNHRQYMIHRLIWIYHNGAIPKGYQIDHIDHDKLNNFITNLRLVTPIENSKNRPLDPKNTSGYNGVCWEKSMNKWKSSIKSNGITITLGFFSDKEEAYKVRKENEKKYGFHENHGKPLK